MTNLPESIWADEGDDRVEYVRADIVTARIDAESEPQWQDGYNSAREDLDAEIAHISAREAKLAEIDAHRRKVIAETERQMNALIESSRRIAALEAQLAERVKVKQLEWEEIHQRRSDEDPTTEWNGGYEADSALGYYEISMGFGSDAYYWTVSDPFSKDIGSDFEDPSDAKAAAQADYERRILSALEATPPAPKDSEPTRVYEPYPGAFDGILGSDTPLVPKVAEAMVETEMVRMTISETIRAMGVNPDEQLIGELTVFDAVAAKVRSALTSAMEAGKP